MLIDACDNKTEDNTRTIVSNLEAFDWMYGAPEWRNKK